MEMLLPGGLEAECRVIGCCTIEPTSTPRPHWVALLYGKTHASRSVDCLAVLRGSEASKEPLNADQNWTVVSSAGTGPTHNEPTPHPARMLLREVFALLEDFVNDAPCPPASVARPARAARVLVFSVDDALFCLHIDWVEAVYPRDAVGVYPLRARSGQRQRFVSHAGVPALIVDLREALDLQVVLPVPQRAHYLVARSGSLALALAVDHCLGVRELDLHTQTPVPSVVVRDGGFPVAHIVSLDGRMLAVLDPSHLLDNATRGMMDAMQRRAQGFLVRQARLEALWAEIRLQPDVANLRAFGRLCARNGRPRAAAATRLVLKHLTGEYHDGQATAEPDRLIGTLLRLGLERRTGELVMTAVTNGHKLTFVEGRIVNASADAIHGKAAVARLLAARNPNYHFVDTQSAAGAVQIHDSTAALVITSLEALGAERRTRLH